MTIPTISGSAGSNPKFLCLYNRLRVIEDETSGALVAGSQAFLIDEYGALGYFMTRPTQTLLIYPHEVETMGRHLLNIELEALRDKLLTSKYKPYDVDWIEGWCHDELPIVESLYEER